jgi:hypothetical protein
MEEKSAGDGGEAQANEQARVGGGAVAGDYERFSGQQTDLNHPPSAFPGPGRSRHQQAGAGRQAGAVGTGIGATPPPAAWRCACRCPRPHPCVRWRGARSWTRGAVEEVWVVVSVRLDSQCEWVGGGIGGEGGGAKGGEHGPRITRPGTTTGKDGATPHCTPFTPTPHRGAHTLPLSPPSPHSTPALAPPNTKPKLPPPHPPPNSVPCTHRQARTSPRWTQSRRGPWTFLQRSAG